MFDANQATRNFERAVNAQIDGKLSDYCLSKQTFTYLYAIARERDV